VSFREVSSGKFLYLFFFIHLFLWFFSLTKYFSLVASIPPTVASSFVFVVLPPSPPTLFLIELIEDKLFKNFNQSPSNFKEAEPKVHELNPNIPESSKVVDNVMPDNEF